MKMTYIGLLIINNLRAFYTMKNSFLLLLIYICSILSMHGADATTINLAGKQRMLTQKMTKEILFIANGHNKDANLSSLEKTANLFEKTLVGLVSGDEDLGLSGTDDRKILFQLNKVRKLWTPMYDLVKAILASQQVSTEYASEVAKINLPLLKQMNNCVKLMEKSATNITNELDPSVAAAINLAGKQRMLTQKMSKEFLQVKLGVDAEKSKEQLFGTMMLFEQTLTGLVDGDSILGLKKSETPEVIAQLAVVKELWKEFRPLVEVGLEKEISDRDLEKVYQKNIPLLKQMNKAVVLYEKMNSV